MQAFDGVGCADRFPLAFGEAREGEQPVARFFQAIGDGAAFEPPFADEGLSPRLDLLLRLGVNHVGVIGRDFLVQPIWRVGEKVAVLVNLMPTSA